MAAKSKIKVIFIDKVTKEVTKKVIDYDWEHMKSMIGTSIIEAVRILDYPLTYVLCDENGRLQEEENKKYTQIHIGPSIVFEGNLMLVGASGDEFDDCLVKLEDLIDKIEFKGDDYIDPPLDIQFIGG